MSKKKFDPAKFLSEETRTAALTEYMMKHPEIVEEAVHSEVVSYTRILCSRIFYGDNTKFKAVLAPFSERVNEAVLAEFSVFLDNIKMAELVKELDIPQVVSKEFQSMFGKDSSHLWHFVQQALSSMLPNVVQDFLEKDPDIKKFYDAVKEQLIKEISTMTVEMEVKRLLALR